MYNASDAIVMDGMDELHRVLVEEAKQAMGRAPRRPRGKSAVDADTIAKIEAVRPGSRGGSGQRRAGREGGSAQTTT